MTLMEIFKYFPDRQSCIEYLETLRWGSDTKCPHCDGDNVARKGAKKEVAAHWRCHQCQEEHIELSTGEGFGIDSKDGVVYAHPYPC